MKIDRTKGAFMQEGIGTSPENLKQALILILERRRISLDLLKAHFCSAVRATNMLCVLEANHFITKPFGSNRWEIHYDRIKKYLENPISISSESSSGITLPTTIKNGGLKDVLKGFYLANQNFNIANILTTDLTLSEIDSSLELIEQSKLDIERKRHKLEDLTQQQLSLENKRAKLEETLEQYEPKIKELNESISREDYSSLIVMVIVFIGIILSGCVWAHSNKISLHLILLSAIPVTAIVLSFMVLSVKKKNLNLRKLLIERDDLNSILKSTYEDKKLLESEKERLNHSMENEVSSTLLNASYVRLGELKDVLVKMRAILADTHESQANRLLALEKLIYFVNKKHSDAELLAEQQKATEYAKEQAQYAREQAEETRKLAQATRDVEEAVRKQTEFQAQVEIMKDIQRRDW